MESMGQFNKRGNYILSRIVHEIEEEEERIKSSKIKKKHYHSNNNSENIKFQPGYVQLVKSRLLHAYGKESHLSKDTSLGSSLSHSDLSSSSQSASLLENLPPSNLLHIRSFHSPSKSPEILSRDHLSQTVHSKLHHEIYCQENLSPETNESQHFNNVNQQNLSSIIDCNHRDELPTKNIVLSTKTVFERFFTNTGKPVQTNKEKKNRKITSETVDSKISRQTPNISPSSLTKNKQDLPPKVPQSESKNANKTNSIEKTTDSLSFYCRNFTAEEKQETVEPESQINSQRTFKPVEDFISNAKRIYPDELSQSDVSDSRQNRGKSWVFTRDKSLVADGCMLILIDNSNMEDIPATNQSYYGKEVEPQKNDNEMREIKRDDHENSNSAGATDLDSVQSREIEDNKMNCTCNDDGHSLLTEIKVSEEVPSIVNDSPSFDEESCESKPIIEKRFKSAWKSSLKNPKSVRFNGNDNHIRFSTENLVSLFEYPSESSLLEAFSQGCSDNYDTQITEFTDIDVVIGTNLDDYDA